MRPTLASAADGWRIGRGQMSPTAAIAALPNPDQAKQIIAAWEYLKRTTLQARMHKLGITRPYYENGKDITTV